VQAEEFLYINTIRTYINMADLGPLFGTRAIGGPIAVIYTMFDGIHLYWIGEQHDIQGNIEHKRTTVVEQLRTFTKEQSRKVLCYCESSARHADVGIIIIIDEEARKTGSSILELAKSPIWTYIGYASHGKIPNIDNCYADIRNMAPYNLYTLITTPDAYRVETFGPITTMAERAKVRRFAKLAEKAVLEHITTRLEARAFLESLCLVDSCYPDWFVELYKKINETSESPPAPLRNMMARLQSCREGAYYNLVVDYMRHLHGKWAVDPYTLAMARVISMRQTRVPNLVAQTNANADHLFIEMSAFLMDIFVIVDVLIRSVEGSLSPGDTAVFFGGGKHAENISMFFAWKLRCETRYKFDAHGDIREGPAVPRPLALGERLPAVMASLKDKPRHVKRR
jgi:hypothetical protein